MNQGSMSRLVLAVVLLLTSSVLAVTAHAAPLSPGDILVAAQFERWVTPQDAAVDLALLARWN